MIVIDVWSYITGDGIEVFDDSEEGIKILTGAKGNCCIEYVRSVSGSGDSHKPNRKIPLGYFFTDINLATEKIMEISNGILKEKNE